MAQITAKQYRYGCGVKVLALTATRTNCVRRMRLGISYATAVIRTDTQTIYVCNECWDFSMGYYATRVKGETNDDLAD
jgi:hypothetical protein